MPGGFLLAHAAPRSAHWKACWADRREPAISPQKCHLKHPAERRVPRPLLLEKLYERTVPTCAAVAGQNHPEPTVQLNLNDVESIVSWWSVFPARHQLALEQILASRPQFSQAIRAAQLRIASSERMQEQLNRSLALQDQHLFQMAERRAAMSSVEILRRDMAMAA